MSDVKINEVVRVGNELIDALRAEADHDVDSAPWRLTFYDVKWMDSEDLVNLTQLSHSLSQACLELEGG